MLITIHQRWVRNKLFTDAKPLTTVCSVPGSLVAAVPSPFCVLDATAAVKVARSLAMPWMCEREGADMSVGVERTFPLVTAFTAFNASTLLSSLLASSSSARLAPLTSPMPAAWMTGSKKRTVEMRRCLRCIVVRRKGELLKIFA